ncbi:hypothetical protein BDQ17DRAFT_437403 [Cyathus striatus]|nr:hypothetical protein BDQ17DRAFT_437403 [Cyathus striatus]
MSRGIQISRENICLYLYIQNAFNQKKLPASFFLATKVLRVPSFPFSLLHRVHSLRAMDGNLATTYTLIYSFLTKQSQTKAAEAVKKAAKGVVVLKDDIKVDGPQLDEIIRQWKAAEAMKDESSDSSSSSDSDSDSSSSSSSSSSDAKNSSPKKKPAAKAKAQPVKKVVSSKSSDSSSSESSSDSDSDSDASVPEKPVEKQAVKPIKKTAPTKATESSSSNSSSSSSSSESGSESDDESSDAGSQKTTQGAKKKLVKTKNDQKKPPSSLKL